MNIFPDDVVIAILHHIQSDNNERHFTTDREQLHCAFFDLKTKYPKLLESFRFRDKGLFPESETLDQALSNLEASGLLQRHNDTPRYYFIQNKLDKSFSQYVDSRLKAQGIDIGLIDKAAKDFAEKTVNKGVHV